MGGFSNVALDNARVWSQNVYTMRKALGCSDSFQVFVVCPACHKDIQIRRLCNCMWFQIRLKEVHCKMVKHCCTVLNDLCMDFYLQSILNAGDNLY